MEPEQADMSLGADDLVAYYKKRIDDFEAERERMLEVLDRASEDSKSLYRIRWENRKRGDEVRELQKALSDSHSYLFEERERLLQLKAENEELRLQETEDRRKIQLLLEMTRPTENEIALHPGQYPASINVFPREDGRRGTGQQAGPSGSKAAAPGVVVNNVLRAVTLPSEAAEAMGLRIRALQTQLDEQKQFAEERISALLEDRRIREMDHQAQMAAANEVIDDVTGKLRKAQDLLEATTREVILARRERDRARDAGTEAAHALESAREAFAAELGQVQAASMRALEATQKEQKSETGKEVGALRSQLKLREKEIRQLQNMSTAVQENYQQRVQALEAQCAKLQGQARQAEARRLAEAEGFSADITLLRKRIANLERRLLQLRLADRLADDERLDGLLGALDRQIAEESQVKFAPRAARALAARPPNAPLALVRVGGDAAVAVAEGSPLRLVDKENAHGNGNGSAAQRRAQAAAELAGAAAGPRTDADLLTEIQRVRELLTGLEGKLKPASAAR